MKGLIAIVLLATGLVLAVFLGACDVPDEVASDAPAESSVEDGGVPSAGTADPGNREALEPVRALFDGMRARDTTVLAAVFHPDARLNSTSVRDGSTALSEASIPDFVRSIGASEADLDERLGPADVRVDGGLATAWMPYAFFVDGEFSHCGVNAFQLVRTDDGWKILQVTDTRRQEACPEGAPR